jgi:hypothetical protein
MLSAAAVDAAAPGREFFLIRVRKVRAAQGTVLDNVKAEQSDGKCNRKIPLWRNSFLLSKGEMVR